MPGAGYSRLSAVDELQVLECGRFRLPLARPLVMGIVNVTPDSFSDGGLHRGAAAAAAYAQRLIDEGADIVDIGGESTRPGSSYVALEEERLRVLPVIERLAGCAVPISVDTRKPELMREGIAAGASMVNDVNALGEPGALDAVAASGVAVCLMHKRGEPKTMQDGPDYEDVVREVRDYLARRIAAAGNAGISRARIAVDPGFGFGKTLDHNLSLLRALGEFRALGVAVMAGLSRKSMLGALTGREVGHRVPASVAAALVAVQNGAHIVRVHDVAATRDVLAVWEAVGTVNRES
jgi:dihydropteroate synthase